MVYKTQYASLSKILRGTIESLTYTFVWSIFDIQDSQLVLSRWGRHLSIVCF